VEAAAARGDPAKFKFPAPLARRPRTGNVSYAGLKTAVRMAAEVAAPGPPTPDNEAVRADLAASFQAVAVAHLADRAAAACEAALARAADSEGTPGSPPRPTALVLTGGVAANGVVRAAMQGVADGLGLPLVVPAPRLCTDNGVMVAWAGVERARAGLALPLPPLIAGNGGGGGGDRPAEWVEVWPRWPLAGAPAPGVAPPNAQSARKSRVHPNLTQLTEEALASGTAPVAGQWVE
jgi:N6-L-threonylcarbamoyladenine synthase